MTYMHRRAGVFFRLHAPACSRLSLPTLTDILASVFTSSHRKARVCVCLHAHANTLAPVFTYPRSQSSPYGHGSWLWHWGCSG